jgi:hypothetical protein
MTRVIEGRPARGRGSNPDETTHLELESFNCGACVERARKALLQVPSLSTTAVDQGSAVLDYGGPEEEALVKAVQKPGPQAKGVG